MAFMFIVLVTKFFWNLFDKNVTNNQSFKEVLIENANKSMDDQTIDLIEVLSENLIEDPIEVHTINNNSVSIKIVVIAQNDCKDVDFLNEIDNIGLSLGTLKLEPIFGLDRVPGMIQSLVDKNNIKYKPSNECRYFYRILDMALFKYTIKIIGQTIADVFGLEK
uniref:DUF302 domain-containing protein n=1 Tax=Meloidogyne hapla TaxID=6305 RepID=A0A1I8BHJ2_MELHA